MAGETLYEQIAEHKNDLTLIDGDDDENDDAGNEESGDGSVRRQGGRKQAEHPEQGAAPELGGTGKQRPSEGASRSEGGASRRDARASQEDSGRTQEDAPAPQKVGGALQDEEVTTEKPPTSNAEWAKLRREAREAKAELVKLKAAQVAPTPTVATVAETKPADKALTPERPKEPDKNTNYQEWLEWKLAQHDTTAQQKDEILLKIQERLDKQEKTEKEQAQVRADVDAFTAIEKRYTEKNPDYTVATEFARDKYFHSLKMAMPQATDQQINWAIDNEILGYARRWAQQGLDPAEEFYSMTQERFGYTKEEKKALAEESVIEDKSALRRQAERPNLRNITNNRKRSASPLTGGGQGGGIPLTKELAADMSVGEFSRLTPGELADLEAMG